MKKIVLVRHTETDVESGDSSLSEFGQQQAKEIAQFLEKHPYEIVLTSLLKRAQQTAKIINQSQNKKIIASGSFNEYLVREDNTEVETTSMGVARSMTKIYSLYDLWEEVLLVAHASINRTIIRSLLNIDYEKAEELFNHYGETYVLRYDWQKGDNHWQIVDSFIPKQSGSQ